LSRITGFAASWLKSVSLGARKGVHEVLVGQVDELEGDEPAVLELAEDVWLPRRPALHGARHDW
jgi:hypothetical protein